jgi:hypothetical protein
VNTSIDVSHVLSWTGQSGVTYSIIGCLHTRGDQASPYDCPVNALQNTPSTIPVTTIDKNGLGNAPYSTESGTSNIPNSGVAAKYSNTFGSVTGAFTFSPSSTGTGGTITATGTYINSNIASRYCFIVTASKSGSTSVSSARTCINTPDTNS